MAYTKTTWVDGVTPVSAQNMNNLETQYEKAKADLDTHKAEKATDSAPGHVQVDGDTIVSSDGIISVASGIYQSAAKSYGHAEYANNMSAGQKLTKRINIGTNKKYGKMTIHGNSLTDSKFGIIVYFETNKLNALIAGYRSRAGYDYSDAWSRRWLGSVTMSRTVDNDTGYGDGITGHSYIQINEIWINGSYIDIEFENKGGSQGSLNCRVDWEVW